MLLEETSQIIRSKEGYCLRAFTPEGNNPIHMYLQCLIICYVVQQSSILVFSSPELKAQVSYSDRPLSVVRLSVCPSVRPSVRPSVCL
jgi:hypothetical protein